MTTMSNEFKWSTNAGKGLGGGGVGFVFLYLAQIFYRWYSTGEWNITGEEQVTLQAALAGLSIGLYASGKNWIKNHPRSPRWLQVIGAILP